MTEILALAALWLGLALLATLLSIWLRIATALSEIVVGTIAQLVIGVIIGWRSSGPTRRGSSFSQWCKPLGFEARAISSGEPQACLCKSDFGSLMEFLILEAGLGNLTPLLLDLGPSPHLTLLSGFEQLRIIFHRSEPSVSVEFRHALGKVFEIWFEPKRRQQTHRALRTSTTVTQDCLTALGLVLADEVEPSRLRSRQVLLEIYRKQAGLRTGASSGMPLKAGS
jgi:hypothetical protein